jgi:hypothetical protein
MGYASSQQNSVNVSAPEAALSGLVDDRLVRPWRQFVDDVMAVLSSN